MDDFLRELIARSNRRSFDCAACDGTASRFAQDDKRAVVAASESLSLQDVDGAGGEQDDGREGDEGLDHHQGLGPAGEDGAVSGGEGGAGVEGEEEVVDEAGGPAGLAHLAAGGGVQGHLGEEEGAVGLCAAQLAGVGAAGVEPPVPGGKDEDVGEPEGACGAEEIARAFAMHGERADEEIEGPDHVDGDDAGEEVTKDPVEGVVVGVA
jgi:hypothetical protein